MIHELRALDLLRSHVMGCADDLRLAGQIRAATFAAHDLGDAEVGNFHPALFVEQDILRFDVAMDHAMLMGELERLTNFRHDGQCLLRLDSALSEQLAQARTIHVFHHEVVKRLRCGRRRDAGATLPEVMHGDDVGMAQPSQSLGFAEKPLGELGVCAPFRRENLERNEAIQFWLARLIDGAHAAFANQFDDLQLWEKGR